MILLQNGRPSLGPSLSLALICGSLLVSGCDVWGGSGIVKGPPGPKPDAAELGRPFGNPPPVTAKARKSTEALEKNGLEPTSNPRL